MKVPDTEAEDAPWCAYRDDTHYGTGILSVPNRTHLNWKYLQSKDLSEQDDFWIVKNP